MTNKEAWISCDKKLPEIGKEVLATLFWGDITIAERYNNDNWLIHEGTSSVASDSVIAWMPLPIAFKLKEEI